MKFRELESGPAVFSDDRVYRYTLTRAWNPALPTAMFIGLNPSTADENRLDRTLRRVIDFVTREGCGALVMANLFAFRSKDPHQMKRAPDPIGPQNDAWLARLLASSELVVCGWGIHGAFRQRSTDVRMLLRSASSKARCLGLTATGEPLHPLYLKATTPLIPFLGAA